MYVATTNIMANIGQSNRVLSFIHDMPQGIKSPSATRYGEIKWAKGYEQWELVRFFTPMDGSCLFHAITNSFFEPYHIEKLNGEPMSREKIIASFRKELSTLLYKVNPNDPDKRSYYEFINGGNTKVIAHAEKEDA